MTHHKDRTFRRFADRADMREVLAAELGRFGADKRLIMAMCGLVREDAGDVFVSDDDDELIMLIPVSAKDPLSRVVHHGRAAGKR
jgi:hypothetical protein